MKTKNARIISVVTKIVCALSILCGLFFLNSCKKEEPPQNISLSANRKMGVVIRKMNFGGIATMAPDWRTYFGKLSESALQKAFGAQTETLTITPAASTIDDPESMYVIGIHEIDDIVLLEVQMPAGFVPANSSVNMRVADNELEQYLSGDMKDPTSIDRLAHFAGRIENGANLKGVAEFKFSVPTTRPDLFVPAFQMQFRKSIMAAYPNPNIYPKSVPQYFANLLYAYSKRSEKDVGDKLDCDSAPDVLKYYPKAADLFKKALDHGTSKVVGQQSEVQQLQSRLEETQAMSKVLDDCRQDAQLGFQVKFDFDKINKDSVPFVQRAYDNSGLDQVLRAYTRRPVHIKFQVEDNSKVTLVLDMRFDRPQFAKWSSAMKIPGRIGQFGILALDPFKALMQKMVVLRASLPFDSPAPLIAAFTSMGMLMNLKTVLQGNVSFAVDGRYYPEQKTIKMAYPNAVSITAPGYQAKAIATRNDTIFQDRGWIALGNCKTLEGALTEDGLVYKFFGFPCE